MDKHDIIFQQKHTLWSNTLHYCNNAIFHFGIFTDFNTMTKYAIDHRCTENRKYLENSKCNYSFLT